MDVEVDSHRMNASNGDDKSKGVLWVGFNFVLCRACSNFERGRSCQFAAGVLVE